MPMQPRPIADTSRPASRRVRMVAHNTRHLDVAMWVPWVEFLRGTGHPAHMTLKHHLDRRSPLASTEVVMMELLAGARTDRERDGLRARVLAFPLLGLRGLPDFEV